MKKIILIIASVFGLGLTSCVDLDRYPLEELSDGSYWKSPNDAVAAVSDLYNSLPEFEQDDCINSDDAVHGIKWAAGNVSKGIYDPQDFSWKGNYSVIRQANLVLTKIDEIPDYNESDKNKVLGQAYFFRAMQYFFLIRNFGDVPYVDKPLELSEQADITRAPKDEVYKKLMADFDKAIEYLPVSWGDPDKGRITKGGALAMKARAALTFNDWNVAAESAKKVMAEGKYSLYDAQNTGNYKKLFWQESNGCDEFVIVKQRKSTTDYAAWLIGWETFPTLGWGGVNPTQSLVDAFEDKDGAPISSSRIYDEKHPFENRDPRLEVVVLHDGEVAYGQTIKVAPLKSCYPTGIGQHGDATATGYYQNKWIDPSVDPQSTGWDYDKDEVVIRYAEVLLTFAEAKNELSPLDDEAFKAVNEVRSRVGMPDLQKTDASKPTYCSSQDDLRQRIRNERRVEFALENGLRQWDVRRWGIAKTVLNGPIYGLKYKLVDSPDALAGDGGKICILYEGENVVAGSCQYSDYNYVYPVPQEDRDLNKGISQNDGYGE